MLNWREHSRLKRDVIEVEQTSLFLSMWIACRSIRHKLIWHVDNIWSYACFILSLGLSLIKTNRQRKTRQNKNTILAEQKGSYAKFSSLSTFFISLRKLSKEVRSTLYQKTSFSLAYKCMCIHCIESTYLIHQLYLVLEGTVKLYQTDFQAAYWIIFNSI